MTNPNNAIGTNAAFGGRTSVNAFNDGVSAFSRGIMSGWECVPNSGMVVSLGGNGIDRDVAIAEDGAGNKTTINNISAVPVNITIASAPANNSRIDAIVAYVDNPPQGSDSITDNYEACGLISVRGTASANPLPPNDTTIRTAITADGASGVTAYYVVLAKVIVENGTTDISSAKIQAGDIAKIASSTLDFASFGVLGLPLATSLPTTASNGSNVLFSTGERDFGAGLYLLSMPSIMSYVSTVNYIAYVSVRIDNDERHICEFASYGRVEDSTMALFGSLSFCIPIEIAEGRHTIQVRVGTNHPSKSITIEQYQNVEAWLTRIA